MRRSLKTVYLPQEAIGYLENRLQEGNSLSRLVAKKIVLSKGKMKTWLPSSLDPREYLNFEMGGKFQYQGPLKETRIPSGDGVPMRMVPKAKERSNLVREIKKFLTTSASNSCIFENALAKRTDPWLTKAKSRILFFGDEVYHVLLPIDTSVVQQDRTMREAESSYPPLIGFLCTFSRPLGQGIEHAVQMTSQEMESFAHRTVKIIVGAYDGEGYLLWSKKDPKT